MAVYPSSIHIELCRLEEKIDSKTEYDMEFLSVKQRLEKILEELNRHQLWRKSNSDDYDSLEREIKKQIRKVDKVIDANRIAELRCSLEEMREDLNDAFACRDFKKLSRLTGYILNARKSVSQMIENPSYEELKSDVEKLMELVGVLKQETEEFCFKCIGSVEKCIEYFKQMIDVYSDTRYEINFTKFHSLVEVSLNNLKAIDVKDPRSHITLRKRQVIKELESLQTSFNSKVYENEENASEITANESNNAKMLELIREVEKLHKAI